MNHQTKKAHTMLPWSIRFDTTVYGSGNPVCETKSIIYGSDISKANAAFIVKACNNHDELIEVLKLFYNNCKCDDNDEMRIMINKARQILAKVGA